MLPSSSLYARPPTLEILSNFWPASIGRPSLSGVCYDLTRSWEETLQPVSLPVGERLAAQLVRLPPLDTASEKFVRRCGYALKKVLLGLMAQSKQVYGEDAAEREFPAVHS